MTTGGSTIEATSPELRFRRLYAAHHLDIYGYLRRRADTETARDADAETFLVAWRRIDEVPEGDAARLWLYGVARRTLANQWRSQRRIGHLRRRIASLPQDLPPTPETLVVRDAASQEILDALGRLGEADREVLRLAAWEELSHEEIGAVMGCSAHAVDQRLLRARRRLERELHHGRSQEGVPDAQPEKGGAS